MKISFLEPYFRPKFPVMFPSKETQKNQRPPSLGWN